jgi:LPXTG-motif cell wall-anchored protein
MQDDKGKITIQNPDANETYYAYKILDLASFTDDATDTDLHDVEAYAYVISADSDWLPFILNTNAYYTGNYFVCDTTKPIQIKNKSGNYYIVTPHSDFTNPFDDTTGSKDETTFAEIKSSALVQSLAAAAKAFANSNNAITPDALGDGSKIISNKLPLTTNGETVSGGNDELDLGYYIIDSTMGTLCALDTTNKEAKINEKNVVPQLDKEVKEDSLTTSSTLSDAVTGYKAQTNSQNDADVGQNVYFRTKITVQKGAEAYILKDKMDDCFSYNNDLKVYFLDPDASLTTLNGYWHELNTSLDLDGSDATTADKFTATGTSSFYTTGTAVYTPASGGDPAVNSTFSVAFTQPFLTFLSDQMAVNDLTHYNLMVTYSAKLTSKNVKYDEIGVNDNAVKLEYGHDNAKTEIGPVITHTATWSTKIRKYTTTDNNGSADDERALAGAHFQVFRTATTGAGYDGAETRDALKFVQESDGVYRYDERVQSETLGVQGSDIDTPPTATYSNTTDYNVATDETVVDTLTTSTGIITIKGLDGDTYYLKETLAPFGYNQLTGDIPFHIISVEESTMANNDAKRIMAGANQAKEVGQVVCSAPGSTIDTSAGIKFDGYAEDAANLATTTATQKKQIGVLNTTSAELPSTGGMGTTVLYIVGGMLVILAGAYLFFSRKRTA